MEAPLLEIRDVKKYFPVKKVHGKEITVKAVDSINLKINQGEIVAASAQRLCRRVPWRIRRNISMRERRSGPMKRSGPVRRSSREHAST